MSHDPDNSSYFKGFYNKSPGIAAVGSYQVSGHPFLTGNASFATNTTQQVDFPNVTRRILIRNTDTDAAIKVHFRPTGSAAVGGIDQVPASVVSASHFITVQPMTDATIALSQLDMQVKCRRIYITNDTANAGSWELFAELTGIDANQMYELTGSGITGF